MLKLNRIPHEPTRSNMNGPLLSRADNQFWYTVDVLQMRRGDQYEWLYNKICNVIIRNVITEPDLEPSAEAHGRGERVAQGTTRRRRQVRERAEGAAQRGRATGGGSTL